jgi:hypothetical protein
MCEISAGSCGNVLSLVIAQSTASTSLSSEIKPIEMLIVNEVGLTIDVPDTTGYQSISHFTSTATINKGGDSLFFGFHLDANRDSSYSRDILNITSHRWRMIESLRWCGGVPWSPTKSHDSGH